MGAGMRYQPQGLTRIEHSNPLTRGLIFLAPLVGGNDLVNIIDNGQATSVVGPMGTGVNSRGKFAHFNLSRVDFASISHLLGPNDPASVGWIQQPIGASGYHGVLQFCTSGVGTKPFLIYQSTSVSSFYFTAGLRGVTSKAHRFGDDVGPLTNGRIDTFVLTSTGGFGTAEGLSLFRGNDKFVSSTTTTFSNSSSTVTSIGHISAGTDRWAGLLGCVAIWNRVLTDEEARSYNDNPWQLFAAPEEEYSVSTAGGATSYLFTATAGLNMAATTQVAVGKVRIVVASGGGLFTPTAGVTFGAGTQSRDVVATAGLTLTGTVPAARSNQYTLLGGLTFDGRGNATLFPDPTPKPTRAYKRGRRPRFRIY